MKQNKFLAVLVIICLALGGYNAWMCYSLSKQIEELRQERLSQTKTDDIFNEALKLIENDADQNKQPLKKKGLMDRAKSAAQAKAMDMVADKVKKSVQKSADEQGKDATVALKGIDMIFRVFEKALDAEEGLATETDVAREMFSGLKEVAQTAAQEEDKQ